MRFLPLLLLIIQWCDARVASIETDVGPTANTNVKDKEPLTYPCTLRTLPGSDHPSVVVKYQNQIQRLTWDSNGHVKFDRDYKLPSVSVSYPSSGGLSGDGGVGTTAKPFSDAPVVPDYYSFEDIVQSFSEHCVLPKY